MKIYTDSECPRGCSEEYVVKFWIQKPDGFWEKTEKSYFAMNSRRAHDAVVKRWNKDYSNKNVSYISVTYQ